jgi:hypothetical protein
VRAIVPVVDSTDPLDQVVEVMMRAQPVVSHSPITLPSVSLK